MKRAYFIVAAIVLAVVGFLLSVLVIPSDSEIALIHFKDKQYDKARALYEQQYESGNLSLDVVMHLTGVYLQFGDVDKAIAVMEDFVARHPDHLAARRELGSLYQYGQRLDDYARNLEAINRLQADPDNLKILADMYQFNETYDKQVPVVVKLLESNEQTSPRTLAEGARMLAAEKKYEQAARMLRRLREQSPDSFGHDETELLIRLLIDAGRHEAAVAEAMRYQAREPALEDVAAIANILNYQVSPDAAYRFLMPYEDKVPNHAGLLGEYVLVLMRRGETRQAYKLLLPRYEQGSLPETLRDEMLFLAVEQGDEQTARGVMHALDFGALDENTLIALIELGLSNDVPELVRLIHRAAHRDTALPEHKPRLDAVLALATGEADNMATLQALPYDGLAFAYRAQLARVCARVEQAPCLDLFERTLPPPARLNEREALEAAEIFLAAKRYETGYDYLKPVQEQHRSAAFQMQWVRLAAAIGDWETLGRWLNRRREVTNEKLLADLYFYAFRAEAYPLAVRLAERITALRQTTATRDYLVQAYLRNDQLTEAVALLRQHRAASAEDAANYLFALIQLAKQDPAYRDELAQYAQSRLAREEVAYQQRAALIYALIDAGIGQVAMPYVRDIALREGGEWVTLYADYLVQSGEIGAVTAFWDALRGRSHVTSTQLSQIAYRLLDEGHREQAARLFEELAHDASADSPVVRQLVYLWGPNLSLEQMQWLGGRAAQADSTAEKKQWMRYLVDGSNAKNLMQYVRMEPLSLNYAVVEAPYLAALTLTDKRTYLGSYLTHRIEHAASPAALQHYATLAIAHNMTELADTAYRRLLAQQPDYAEALLRLGVHAHNRADYSASRRHLSRYVRLLENDRIAKTPASYQAYFYLGEMARRAFEREQMQTHFQRTVQEVQAQPDPSVEAQTKMAQALAYAGDPRAAREHFDWLLARYPHDGTLRAEYVSLLIALQDYDAAREVLAGYEGPRFMRADLKPMVLRNEAIASYALHGYDQHLVVHFNPQMRQPQWLNNEQVGDYGWASYTAEGVGRAMLVSRPNYRMQVDEQADGSLVIAPIPVISEAEIAQAEAMDRRFALLDARIRLETGEGYAARRALNRLLAQYPDNAEVLGFTANAEHFLGNWPRALQLLGKAQARQPENEDIARLNRNIMRRHAPHVFADHAWRMLGDNDEQITTLGGNVMLDHTWDVGLQVQHNRFDTTTIRRVDGRIGTFDGDRQRGELYAAHYWPDGARAKASLFANNDTLGGGLAYRWINPFGRTELVAEYRRPYWDFVEAVVDNATRDKLAVQHRTTLQGDVEVTARTGVANYHLDGDDNVIQTGFFGGQVTVPVVQEPHYIAIGYGLDAEYEIDEDARIDAATGQRFQSLPLDSREIHFVSLIGSKRFGEDTVGDATVGYAYDRLGDHGPAAEVRLTHYLTERFSLQGRASYGLSSSDTNDDVTRVGVQLKYRH